MEWIGHEPTISVRRKDTTMPKFDFDEIKRSASGVADRAVKKTGEVTSLVRLKVSLRSAEAKLKEVYEEIGRLFYTAERKGEDCTSDTAAYIMKADKLKADIAAINKQIAKLRNVRICETCGHEISQNVNFCPICGAKQDTLVEVEPEEADEAAEEAVEEAAETVTDAFEEAKDKAEEFFANIADTVSDKAEDVKDAAEDLADKAEDVAEEVADKIEDVVSDSKDGE